MPVAGSDGEAQGRRGVHLVAAARRGGGGAGEFHGRQWSSGQGRRREAVTARQSGGGWAQEHWDFTASPLWGSKGDEGWPEVLAGIGGGASGGALMVAGGADSILAKERLNRVRGGAVEVEGRVDGLLGDSGRAGRRRGDELRPARRVAALCTARHGSPRTGKRNGVAKSNLASESAVKGLSGGGARQRGDAWLLRHCTPPFKQNTEQTDLKCPPPV